MENKDTNPRETSTVDYYYYFLKRWFRGHVTSKIRKIVKQTCDK